MWSHIIWTALTQVILFNYANMLMFSLVIVIAIAKFIEVLGEIRSIISWYYQYHQWNISSYCEKKMLNRLNCLPVYPTIIANSKLSKELLRVILNQEVIGCPGKEQPVRELVWKVTLVLHHPERKSELNHIWDGQIKYLAY